MKTSYRIIIGDNSFLLNANDDLLNIIKNNLGKDIKLIEYQKFEDINIKTMVENIYRSMTNVILENKVKFISEFMELIIKENHND